MAAGNSVAVIGTPGSGRSHLLREVEEALDEPARSRLWIGEDAHLFTPEHAARLAAAISSGRVTALLSAESGSPLPAPFSSLTGRGLLIRMDLEPLRAYELQLVAESMLGGRLDTASAAWFVPRRGGSDLAVLRESIRGSVAAGVLASPPGSDTWSASEAPSPSVELRRLVQSHARCSPDDATAMLLLDVAALMPEASFETVSSVCRLLGVDDPLQEALERFETLGTMEVLDRPDGVRFRLRDGLLELVLPQSLGVMRRRRLASAIVAALEETDDEQLAPGETIALAAHGLALGNSVDVTVMTRAAKLALRGTDMRLAHRLARAAVDQGGGFDAEIALASIESQLGLSRESMDRLERLLAEAGDDPQRGEVLATLGQLVRERADLDHSRRTFHRMVESSRAQDAADPGQAFLLSALGDSIGARELLVPLLPELHGEALSHAHYVVATAGLLTGEFAETHRALDAGQLIAEEMGADTSRFRFERAVAESFDGGITSSLEVMRDFRRSVTAFGLVYPQAMCGWSIGSLLLMSGRAREAATELLASITLLDGLGMRRTARIVRTDLVTAQVVAGDLDGAARTLEEASENDDGDLDVGGSLAQASAWLEVARGNRDAAVAGFVKAAEVHHAAGHRVGSLVALVEAARAGGAETVLTEVEALGAKVEGAFAAVLVQYCRVLSRHAAASAALVGGIDVEADRASAMARGFDDVGSGAAGLSAHLIAAEAFARASEAHDQAGDRRAAAASARHRDEQLGLCGLDRLPLAAVSAPGSLSAREFEIASLAASGLTNREISERLVLSVRTVETHLLRVYRKLGVRTRVELDEALTVERASRSSILGV